MRTLPDHPDLSFYRKEAKRLVREYREQDMNALARVKASHPRYCETGEPEAGRRFSLHDAQLVIAREHGLPSWPKLKHLIEFRTLDASDMEQVFEQFKLSVNTENPERLRTLLAKYPALKARLDEPVFAFNSSAVVFRKRNRELLEILLDAGADLHRKSDWWAGGFGVLDENPEHADWLMSRGARLDAYSAASLGKTPELLELLNKDPAVVNQRFGDGQTPLHVAANAEIVSILLDAGADVSVRCLDHRSTPIQYLIQDEQSCRLLMEHGAEMDVFVACRLGDLKRVQHLAAEHQECLTHRVGEGDYRNESPAAEHIYTWKLMGMETPPRVAHTFGHRKLYEWLMNQSPPGQQFVEACWQADRQRATRLLQENPEVLLKLDPAQKRALPGAVWEKRTSAVSLMLELGWDVNTRGVHDSTPLDRAAIRGQAEMVEQLLTYGPELNPVNEFKGTPLSACLWGKIHFRDPDGNYVRTLRALLDAGCLCEHGDSPKGWIEMLWFALRFEQFDTVPLLQPFCRDLNMVDDEGCTALDLALMKGADDTAAFLREQQAKTSEELRPGS